LLFNRAVANHSIFFCTNKQTTNNKPYDISIKIKL